MEMGKHNAFTGHPIYVPNPRYLELVELLLNRKLSHDVGDFAPLRLPTIDNCDHPPGDLSEATDTAVFAEVGRLLGDGMVAGWDSRNEDERIPLIESAIKARGTKAEATADYPPLSENDVKVLLYLYEQHPILRRQADIEAGAELSRGTIGPCLERLREARLVSRPKGKRKGDGLTTEGMEVAKRLAHIPPR